ncbi:uncharacterized protein LOC136042025 isoform X2 [Artemia franciscana]|uniref:Ig-like domain-containing protein n=1 Tax=Artemia franciscana TaxID=6661 RepID=A0AA88H2M5_ARTSF|nr:hypothetical protein QYM36_018257 [Artemia franciscana]
MKEPFFATFIGIFFVWPAFECRYHRQMDYYVSRSFVIPKFENTSYVAATSGKIASLPCKVKSLGNKTVSWLRHRDLHLLTVGVYTYTTDQRFRANHVAGGDSWNLEIRYVQERDAGIYECQMGSTPTVSQYVNLTVMEASSVILGGPELYIDKDSTINLTCLVRHSEPPDHVFWTINDKILSYDSSRGGISVLTQRMGPYETLSSLRLLKAKENDAGFYKCRPTSGLEATIMVHVLEGEVPAAMQRSNRSMIFPSILFLCLSFNFIFPLKLNR